MTENLPIPVQISTLDREISAITEILRPKGDGVVLLCLETLLTAGFSWPTGIEPAKGPEVYGFALAKVPAVGIERSTRRLIRGEYPRDDHGFLPRPPEWAVMASGEARVLAEDRKRVMDRRDTLAVLQRKPIKDAAAKERVRTLVAKVAAARTVGDEEVRP